MRQVAHRFNAIGQHSPSIYRVLLKSNYNKVVTEKCDIVDLWLFAVKTNLRLLATWTLVIRT
jgi:hypothetical protein